MSKPVYGVIHGNTIVLAEQLDLSDGQEVQVYVKAVSQKQKWGEGLRRCAGAMADEWTAEDDRILEQIYQERKRDSRQEIAE